MDAFFDALGNVLKSILHFLSNLYHYFSVKWQEEQSARQQFQNSVHWNTVSQMIQEELFLILKNSPYDCLNSLFCSDNINNAGWSVHEKEIVYHYDIYNSTPPNRVGLEQIRQKLNIKISQYQQQFIQQYGHEQTALTYPCIYHGMYITSIQAEGAMIHLEIISHLSLSAPKNSL